MGKLREIVLRAWGAVRKDDREDERLAEELAFHRQMLEEDLRRRGRPADVARREAAVTVGGAVQVAEAHRDQRGLPFLDALAQDLRYGSRMLRRAPGFTAAAVLTLALGIGANTAIFSIVDTVLLRPLPYADPDRLVTMGDWEPDGTTSTVGYLTFADWRAQSRSFESLALMRSFQPALVAGGEAERVPGVRVSWTYFDMIGVRPQLGRVFTADEDRPDAWRVVLLSDGLWRRRFSADPNVIGRTIVMNDREYRIVGVLPASFKPLDAARFYATPEIWAPLGYEGTMAEACRSCQHLRAFGRLAPGVEIGEAVAELNAIRQQQRVAYPTEYDESSVGVVRLQDVITGNVRLPLQVLLAAVAFVMLIACANVANLLIARSLVRKRELALRCVLGAGRRRIVRQLMTESAMLTVCGAALGIVLAMFAVRTVGSLAPVSLPRLDEAAIDGRVLAYSVLLSVISALLFGIGPAFRTGRTDPQRALAMDTRTSTGGASRARSVLVVFDLALALVLLAGAGLMLRSVAHMVRADPGFDPSRVLTMQFSLVGKAYAQDEAVVAFQQAFLERARHLPGVESVALAGQVPFGGDFDCWGFHAKGRMMENTAEDPCVQVYGSSPDFLRVMKIPLLAGRYFDARDSATSPPVLVISQAAARLVWGDADPIGSEVRIGGADDGPWRTVIGIVADTHHSDVTAPAGPAMYLPETQLTQSFLVAAVRSATNDPAALAAPVRAILRDLDSAVPVDNIATLESLVTNARSQQVFVMQLLSGFAAVAVLLAAVGLYGVVSYTVAQRTRELGIRVALGARPADLLRLVLSKGAVLVVIGLAAGVFTAGIATRYLGTLVFGVSPVDPVTFGAATILLSAVALGAHVVPIRRALGVDPTIALRQE